MLVGYGRTSAVDQEAGIEAQERDLLTAGYLIAAGEGCAMSRQRRRAGAESLANRG
jgi:hypothetical protein